MEEDMGLEIIRSTERFLAEFARVGLLSGVCPFVSLQVLLAAEFFGAAFEGTWFASERDAVNVVGEEELLFGSLYCSSSLSRSESLLIFSNWG
jgi:hypothetical protein